jgi:dienelactone hydrolase
MDLVDLRDSDKPLDAPTQGRRSFLACLGLGGMLLGAGGTGRAEGGEGQATAGERPQSEADSGSLYPQIKTLADQCRYPLSFLSGSDKSVVAYRQAVREKVLELFHYQPAAVTPAPEVVGRWEYSDYIQEKILFSTAPWFRVPAYVLIPRGRTGPRPGIVDLHSHGGMYVYGKEKVMPIPEDDSPSINTYRQQNYEGRSTSLALCRRGYVVVSIDAFYFGERRTIFDDDLTKRGWDRSKYSPSDVAYLNGRSSDGEGILARSLYWAGTTWQGIAHWDDIRTVDYLLTRPEVDPARIGCLGISMGGDRTDYLAGLDERIKCAISVGWMSTLRPMIRKHVDTHSYIHFLPGLTSFLDLPDLLGCMVPKPLMVMQCKKDQLYPLEGMMEAVDQITAIYAKAGAASMFQGRFYDQPHIFNVKMQEEAFDWMDHWLKP